jgi:cyclic pyranopterin phosphate synthase
MELTHIDAEGNAVMVDVGEKDVTARRAVAFGMIRMSRECFDAVKGGGSKKGDALAVAQVAGIQATKRTPELIPLCHSLNLSRSAVSFSFDNERCGIEARCMVSCEGRTGVEMEALTGVSVALLTIYDMCKAIDKRMVIENIHLAEKSGGKSGNFRFGE